MAIRTVSNTGGEWSTAATWVGGVKPIAGKDSVAFTATSGALLIDQVLTGNVQLKGIDFRNYVNTLTLNGTQIIIDDSNTSARAAFINFGTGGYTVVAKDPTTNTVISASTALYGIVLSASLTQSYTITSNGTAWNHYFEFNNQTSNVITLADNLTLNGLVWSNTNTATILKNNRLIINGNPSFDVTIDPDPLIPPYYRFTGFYFYQCTSIIEINSTIAKFGSTVFDGTQLIINSTNFYISNDQGYSLQIQNSLGSASTVNINSTNAYVIGSDNVIINSAQNLIINTAPNLTFTAKTLNGGLGGDGVGTYTIDNINGDIQISAGTHNITVSNSINGDIGFGVTGISSITATSVTAPNYIDVVSALGFTFNVTNIITFRITMSASVLTFGTISSLSTPILSLTNTLAASTLTATFPNSSISTSVTIVSPTSNITFGGLTTPLVTITSTTAGTLNLGTTSGSITTLNMTTPVASVNKNNCAITTATITSTTSATFTGGSNNIFSTLNTTAPLLVLDAANVMNSLTNINLTTNTTRTIQLTSTMNVNSIICVNTNLTVLTFTGAFDATIGIIDKVIALNLVANRQYTITKNAYLCNCTIASSTSGIRAKFDMIGADEPLISVNATDIDSSLTPRSIHTYFGTVTNCLNWRNFTDCKIPQQCSTF